MQVRPAAVADDGWMFVVADVAQLEPRVLAGMSGDRALARAARGADLYQGMVDDGAVASRNDAKLGLLGAMYGATSGESGRMVAGLTRRYPDAFGLVEEAARAGERGQVVRTLLGRGSPTLGDAWDRDPDDPPADPDSQTRHRRAYGRFTRNFVVQGTGAEWALCWIADLRNRLWRLGDAPARSTSRPHLVFFLHDEVVVHTPAALADEVAAEATEAAATAAGLLFRDLAHRLPAQRLDRAVLRRRGQARSSGRRTSGTARTVGAMTDNPNDTPNDTPWEPPFSGSEVEHVLGALDRLRWTFRFKADGLDAAGLGTRLGPSSLTLGGLLKHLATQEDFATAVKMDGEEMPAEWADNAGTTTSTGSSPPRRATVPRSSTRGTTARSRVRGSGCASGSRRVASTSRWLSRRSSVSRSACAGSCATWSRSTAATPARPTSSARPSTGAWGRTHPPAGAPVRSLSWPKWSVELARMVG